MTDDNDLIDQELLRAIEAGSAQPHGYVIAFAEQYLSDGKIRFGVTGRPYTRCGRPSRRSTQG